MGKKFGLLQAPLFILCLLLLLVNDFYLKQTYHNALTGKLSDVAGLFIFPYFFSCLLSNKKGLVYLATAVLFTLWKSPSSQGFIDVVNSLGIDLHRVVDYSDVLALAVLPFSLWYFNDQIKRNRPSMKVLVWGLASLSVFSFCATSNPRQTVALEKPSKKVYVLQMSKGKLLHQMKPDNPASDNFQQNLSDSLFYLYVYHPENRTRLTVLASIEAMGQKAVVIKPIVFESGEVTGMLFGKFPKESVTELEAMDTKKLERFFEDNYIGPLQKRKKKIYVYFVNLNLLPPNQQTY